jgi:hypothetical protein
MSLVGTVTTALLLLLVADPALAFRCQTRLVTEGDPQAKVRRFCGEPTSIQQRIVYRSGIALRPSREIVVSSATSELRVAREELALHERSVVEVVIEEWLYNLGPNQLMRLVVFENGLVRDVRQLGYGYRE